MWKSLILTFSRRTVRHGVAPFPISYVDDKILKRANVTTNSHENVPTLDILKISRDRPGLAIIVRKILNWQAL